MGNRRLARELALQILFEVEFTNKAQLQQVINRVLGERDVHIETSEFIQTLLDTFVKNASAVDDNIEKYSDNWKIGRMSAVDRNLIRLGVTEILYFTDIPKSVSINEYLEIAKKFGTADSTGFINGILDKIGV